MSIIFIQFILMLEQIEITNYKGIKNLKIDGFKHLNIFVGDTNTSKTSILEAIFISISENPISIIKLSEFRNLVSDEDIFSSLFYDYQINSNIEIISNIDNINTKVIIHNLNKEVQLSLEDEENYLKEIYFDIYKNGGIKDNSYLKLKIDSKKPSFTVRKEDYDKQIKCDFISLTSFNEIKSSLKSIFENSVKTDNLKKVYTKFNNRIKDIRFVANKIVVELEGLENTINIKSMGSGFKTYINILSSIISGNNKYIFIDEIENGLHFDIIKDLFKNILDLSKEYDLQFFVTTHNKELLQKLNLLLENDYDDMVSVYNVFYNKNNDISTVNYTQEHFKHAIEHNNEIRY